MSDWQLQDAEARFGEVVRRSRTEGPQTVLLRGERTAVVLSAEEYDRLTAPRPFVSAADVLLGGPDWPEEMIEAIESARSRELPRDIDL